MENKELTPAPEFFGRLAEVLGVPPEVFMLDTVLEDVLDGWSKEELLVLNSRLYMMMDSFPSDDKLVVEALAARLKPLLPSDSSDIDFEAMIEATVKAAKLDE